MSRSVGQNSYITTFKGSLLKCGNVKAQRSDDVLLSDFLKSQTSILVSALKIQDRPGSNVHNTHTESESYKPPVEKRTHLIDFYIQEKT